MVMENKGALVSKKLTYEFVFEGEIYTIDETENMMEYDIEVFNSDGEQPSNVDDILDAFMEALDNKSIDMNFTT
jgi:hypothetical protein